MKWCKTKIEQLVIFKQVDGDGRKMVTADKEPLQGYEGAKQR